jgi:hypothetical protein
MNLPLSDLDFRGRPQNAQYFLKFRPWSAAKGTMPQESLFQSELPDASVHSIVALRKVSILASTLQHESFGALNGPSAANR